MDQVLRGLHFCIVYIDDALIASSSAEQHKEHLRLVFQRLSTYGILLNPFKCIFGVESQVSTQGIHPLAAKVEAVQQFPRPPTARKLCEFIGLINFSTIDSFRIVQMMSDLMEIKAHIDPLQYFRS